MSVTEEDKDKTTFTSDAGTCRFNRMPFGLINAPATLRRALDIILNKYGWKSCLVYLDDIIILPKNNDQNLKDIKDVQSALYAAGLTLKLKSATGSQVKWNSLGTPSRRTSTA